MKKTARSAEQDSYAQKAEATAANLYRRLGGKTPFLELTNEVEAIIKEHTDIQGVFSNLHPAEVNKSLTRFLASLFDAPVAYKGKSKSIPLTKWKDRGFDSDMYEHVMSAINKTLKNTKVSSDIISHINTNASSLHQTLFAMKLTSETPAKTRGNGSTNGKSAVTQDYYSYLQEAIDTGWASIEFTPDGTITRANANFVSALGYSSESDIVGKHHRIFCESLYASSSEYSSFWTNLAAGQLQAGEFKRVSNSGQPVWINASYTPVKDEDGKVVKVVKIAANITDMVEQRVQAHAIQSAVNTGWASIEFKPDGTIISANENFTSTLGYASSSEIQGQHHRIFCDAAYANSQEYQSFWNGLANGEVNAGEFKRFTKTGEEVWINASYTPIKDENGNVFKVIKIAADITDMIEKRIEADGVQSAVNTGWASIEFHPDGTIIDANHNFTSTLGYAGASEIQGQHHRIFCDPEYARSIEYHNFWKSLADGNVQSGEFKRFTKTGEEVWINASYTPVKDENGRVLKVIKIAADITDMIAQRIQADGVQSAVNTGWASIEFHPDGTIIDANNNFTSSLGYAGASEIQGQHHRIFCDPAYAQSMEYQEFWKSLANGNVQSGEFQRFTKQGESVYINASYTPVVDADGKVIKVIKIAANVTDMVNARRETEIFSRELAKSIQHIAAGEFEFDLELEGIKFDANLQSVIDDLEGLRDNLKSILEEVKNVVQKAGNDGQLDSRLNLDNVQGEWKELVDSVNLLLKSIAEPVLEFNNIVVAMSEGDLTKRFEMESNGDIKQMADGLNIAIENLSSLLMQIEESSRVVADSSENMLTKSDAMRGNTSEVASAIAQMSQGAQDQAIKTDESQQLVMEVMDSANVMSSKADVINGAAEKGQASCENGMKIVKRLVENMTEISDSAGLTSESITILTQRAEEIARTLNVITDIAAQTNLLALNAAIEAARAGDAGRGFAVVAEEIRKLAEDSRQSAVDIEKIIGDVQKDTLSAGKAIETMEGSVKQGNSASLEVEDIFQEIAESSNETFDYSKEIQDASSGQKGSIDKVVKNIEQIVVVAEETAAGSQQVASSSHELNNGMNEITESSGNLSQIASELMQGVNQFKLSEDGK